MVKKFYAPDLAEIRSPHYSDHVKRLLALLPSCTMPASGAELSSILAAAVVNAR
jgi:hypothetical protein